VGKNQNNGAKRQHERVIALSWLGAGSSDVPGHRFGSVVGTTTRAPVSGREEPMTSLITQPQIMATAAADASAIGSAINEAKAAAAGPTTGLVAAAEDEVSAVAAQFFGAYGQEYQALLQQAAAFHSQFVATLAAGGNAYAQTEAEIAGALGLTGGAATSPAVTPVTQAPDPIVKAILIMSGSGTTTPNTTFMNDVYSRYLSNFNTGNGLPPNPILTAVSTAEGLYPVSGVKDLTLDVSLARGLIQLDNAINATITPGAGGGSIAVFGVSQSSILASLEMPKLLAEGFTNGTGGTPIQVSFVLTGNEFNPNGGLLSRFPGLITPSVGITSWGGATPSNDFPTTMWTLEYDGFADFPKYPIDFLADLNAVLGIAFVHGTYATLTPQQLGMAFALQQSGAPSMTTYMGIPTQNLPLLDPVRIIPVIGNPIADLLQPDLRYLINWGYGDPSSGFSTGPADVPTPFGFLPPLSATTALGPDLIVGTQQGVGAFVADLSALTPTSAASLPGLTSLLPGGGPLGGAALTLPTAASLPSTITGIISGIQSANTNIVGTLTTDVSTAYATLLPTADLGAAVLVSVPSYDVNLFLNGIIQAVNGDPAGLINAFGDPIAATVGLTTLTAGIEFFVIENAFSTIVTGTPHPGLM
jgi:PE-PPE domain/PE family